MWGRGASASWANQPRVPGFREESDRSGTQGDAERAERPAATQSRGGSAQLPHPRLPPCPGGLLKPSAPLLGSPWKPAVPLEEREEEESAKCPRCTRGPGAQAALRCCPKAPEPPAPPTQGRAASACPSPRGFARDLPPPACQRSGRSSGPGAPPPWSEGSPAEGGLQSRPRWTPSWSPSRPTGCSPDPASWTWGI